MTFKCWDVKKKRLNPSLIGWNPFFKLLKFPLCRRVMPLTLTRGIEDVRIKKDDEIDADGQNRYKRAQSEKYGARHIQG